MKYNNLKLIKKMLRKEDYKQQKILNCNRKHKLIINIEHYKYEYRNTRLKDIQKW